MKFRIFAIAAVSAAVIVPASGGAVRGSSGAARPDTTVPEVFLTVHVTMSDARIRLDRYSAHRGDEVRFVMRNTGTRVHNFTLGTVRPPGSTGQTGFSSTLKPKEQKLVLLYLDYRGPLPFHSNVRADRNKPGMKGVFKIL